MQPNKMDTVDFRNKNILAPMVRIGQLTTRLQALRYGADLVYSEEVIDYRMLRTKRVENNVTGTVDFIEDDGTIAFQTHQDEKGKVVFQMGTADAKRAVAVAKKIENDVAAIDINMGCPKEFSIKGGMGAALLTQPEKVREILSELVKNIRIPITCKIRVLPDLDDTLKLVKLIESTGVTALGVHGRTREERPRHHNRNDVIQKIAETIGIPVIANGGSQSIKKYEDIEKFRRATGASSVMIARAAQWNTSIFRKEGMLPVVDVIKSYLKLAIKLDNAFCNIKYNVQQLYHQNMESPDGYALMHSSDIRDICVIWGLGDYYEMHKIKKNIDVSTVPINKRKLEDGEELYELALCFQRKNKRSKVSPRANLFNYVKKNPHLGKLDYKTTQQGRFFRSVLTLNKKKYSSTVWQKNKKSAEQSAAAICLYALGYYDGSEDCPLMAPTKDTGHENTIIGNTDDEKSPDNCDKLKDEVIAINDGISITKENHSNSKVILKSESALTTTS
ncbi:tRNA-dihydrouridine(20) synthase [NAD(P)+]-like [Tubulanus polymorphus]|uniref:tRNA-dihydrouridine(20) synthase [NAD(P)+]-like n=1 Tax=Tubulanus polymorphus TaxID=672921 RepID=UPI003DA6A5CB